MIIALMDYTEGSSYKIISNRALDEAQCVRKLIERSKKRGTFFRKKT